jgi:hypothetical protein
MADTHTGKVQILNTFTFEIVQPLFVILETTRGVSQMEEHHPEGDVFNHSLQVLWWAFRETLDTDLILAAMLHDVGKAENSKGHDQIGAKWIKPYVSVKTHWLVEQHMRFWYLLLGDMKKLSKVKELLEHPWLGELAALARWDKLGRDPRKKFTYDKQTVIDRLNLCVQRHFRFNQQRPKPEVPWLMSG